MKAVKTISVMFVKWSNSYEICFITMTSIQASIYKHNNCYRNIFTSINVTFFLIFNFL